MNSYLFGILVVIWWISGFILYIHDLRHDMEISIGWVFAALIMGFLGPLWFLVILFRKMPKIILKKYDTLGLIDPKYIDIKEGYPKKGGLNPPPISLRPPPPQSFCTPTKEPLN